MTRGSTRSSRVRERVDHPVIDGDGHWLEPVAIFLEYLEEEAGSKGVDVYRRRVHERAKWYEVDAGERMRLRLPREAWWGEAGGTLDRATAMIPGLMYERLGDFGIDVALVYPTLGLVVQQLPNEIRQSGCRALNRMNADMLAPYADRMIPVATVPVHSPQEGIEEAEFAVRQLKMRAMMIGGRVKREVPGDPHRTYVDALGIDNDFDYDPFWAKCVELGVAVTDHGGSLSWPDRQSVTNYVFNHIGHHAHANHMGCRGILLGGVARRFPTLNFGFLEGGVGWACQLIVDLVEHFEKRNIRTLRDVLRPANVDLEEFRRLYDKHAHSRMVGKCEDVLTSFSCLTPLLDSDGLTDREHDAMDDFAQSGIESTEELLEMFRRNFYFGCESDDVMTALAFDARLGTMLKPVFSSDVGHFDVLDMSDVLHEAWELVEHGLITEPQFREFTFTNAAKLHTGGNPEFFKGTVVEKAVDDELGLAAKV